MKDHLPSVDLAKAGLFLFLFFLFGDGGTAAGEERFIVQVNPLKWLYLQAYYTT
jgi:hypothetical protein